MGTENDDIDAGTMDYEAVADSLAGDLGLGDANPDEGSATPLPDSGKDVEPKTLPETTQVTAPVTREAPKSWPKETHEYWGKLDPKVQDLVERREKDFLNGLEQYKGDAALAKTFKEVIAPYQALLTAQNISDPAVAVKGLLNAHYQLSQPDEAARTSFMANLLKQYKVDPAKLLEAVGEKPYQDPALQKMTEEINNLKQGFTAEQMRQAEAAKAKSLAEVTAFAADPAHPYFEEVADDIVLLLQDPKLDLKEAYERAVRANPQTWAKEQARIRKEIETDLRQKAEEAAKAARRNKGTDIQGREAKNSPTEVLGTLEDTLRETYREVQTRTS